MASQIVGQLSKVIYGSAVLGVGVLTVQNCLFTVDGGQMAVKFDRINGISTDEYDQGVHFMVPGLQWPIVFNMRARHKLIHSPTLTKDLQSVNVGVRVLHKPEPTKLSVIYDKLGKDYDAVVLPSLMNEVVKTIVAKYDAKELLQKRSVVSKEIENDLIDRAEEFNLLLDDVSITALTYGQEFASAIESKQVAEQEAERAKFEVQRREQEGKAKIIEAEAEAEAAGMLQAAFEKSGTGIIQLRKIEACAEIAETLARSRTVVYLPPGGGGGGGSNILLGINPQ